MRRRAAAAIVLWGAASGLAWAEDAERAQPAAGAGQELYEKYCAQCHGKKGDGQGPATGRVKPAPRDFTPGKYKFRTTPSGMLPTDDDLRKVIRQGLPYTSMPGWPNFTDAEVQHIIDYLKSFSDAFQDPDKRGEPIDIPAPPPLTEESVARGRAVYEAQGCAACHGQLGRGDGLSAPTLKDDWGHHLRPADISQPWTFRGGPTREDMFRTFSTGLNGTPMPTYAESLAVEERWDLVNYMVSLGDGETPNYAELLRVPFLADDLDIARGPELFAAAPVARFPLLGQIIQPGRNFYPSTTSVQVQAVYNRKEIAFLVRWHDMRAETGGTNAPELAVPDGEDDQAAPPAAEAGGGGDDFWGEAADSGRAADVWGDAAVAEGEDDFWGADAPAALTGGTSTEFSDAVALQFPQTPPAGIRKPYFLLGDAQSPIDLWFVDLARPERVRQYTARGQQSLEPSTADEFQVATGYDQGEWYAIFKRELRSTSNVTFQEGQFVPIAFSVWDGFNRERGNRRALSAWFHLYPEPVARVSAVGPMVRTGLFVLFIEILLIVWIRNRFAARRPAPGSAPGIEQRGLVR
jgi:mono/diheme cytochrome c family protein